MRPYCISARPDVEGMKAWEEIVGDRDLLLVVYADFGFADDVVVMLEFADGTYEVGVASSLRPYNPIYHGNEQACASHAFVETINGLYNDNAYMEVRNATT